MRLTSCLCVAVTVVRTSFCASPDPLDSVEKSSAGWIELRAETVRLATMWQTDRALLESTVLALEERATAAEEERDLVRSQTAQDRDENASLQARVDTAAADQARFEAGLRALDQKLIQLRPSLPPRLSDALAVSFASLGGSDLSAGERLQLTVSVLNRCAQFSRMVTSGDEVLRLDTAGEGRMLQVIYWGVSHGYAVDRASRQAWYGSPGPAGWHWELRDDLVEPALKLMAIYSDERDPEFVSAPARLARGPSQQQHP